MGKTANQIITLAGGIEKIAERLGMTPQAVRRWRQHGIPRWHWAELTRMATESGWTLTNGDFEEANQNGEVRRN